MTLTEAACPEETDVSLVVRETGDDNVLARSQAQGEQPQSILTSVAVQVCGRQTLCNCTVVIQEVDARMAALLVAKLEELGQSGWLAFERCHGHNPRQKRT